MKKNCASSWLFKKIIYKDFSFINKTERCQCYCDNQFVAAPKDACLCTVYDAKLEHPIHDASGTISKKINGPSGRYV